MGYDVSHHRAFLGDDVSKLQEAAVSSGLPFHALNEREQKTEGEMNLAN